MSDIGILILGISIIFLATTAGAALVFFFKKDISEKLTGLKINESKWPTYKEEDLISDTINLPVQINGKVRAKLDINREATQEEIIAKLNPQLLEGKEIIKVIYVKGRILNIVVK